MVQEREGTSTNVQPVSTERFRELIIQKHLVFVSLWGVHIRTNRGGRTIGVRPHSSHTVGISTNPIINEGIMSEHAIKAEQDPLGPAGHHQEVASRASPRRYSSFGAAFNFAPNWYRDLWKIPGKKGEKLDRLAISFILLQLFVGLPLLPYAMLHWHSE